MVYFLRSPVCQFSSRARFSASCSARRCFSRRMSSEEMSFISQHFTSLFCDNRDKEAYSMVSGRSATASAVASRCLPAALPAALGSGTLCHRELTAAKRPRSSRLVSRHSLSPVDQKFNLTAAAALEDEDMAGHRFVFQRRLHFCSQPVEAVFISVIPATSQILVPAGSGIIVSVPVSAESVAFRRQCR